VNYQEPQPAEQTVTCPANLSVEAKRVWRRLAPQLIRQGLLTYWDREAFSVFCEAVVQHRRACDMVETALLVKGLHGGLVKNPACQIVRDTAAVVRAFAQEFGLTPSARSGLKGSPLAGDEEVAGILSRSG
jgi:P27 family predicted phage terminase small subunit